MNLNAAAWLGLLIGAAMPFTVSAQVYLVRNHKPEAVIVCASNDGFSQSAASVLQRFVFEMSGAQLKIKPAASKNEQNRILLDNQVANKQAGIREDGFSIQTGKNHLTIKASGDKGILYGVMEVLETYLGVRYFGEFEYSAPKQSTLLLPSIDTLSNPAFRYRQTQFYGISQDTLYKHWRRLELPSEIFASNYWVHTFDRILPSAVYGASNPEYYSFFKGKRQPGKASQWCLTNEELFELVCAKLDSLFKEDPQKPILSVSQNDGNFTNCACPRCKEIDDENGSPSGSLIYFMNKLAGRFPDKEISTLAYLYSMPPPKRIKPLPNVNIMLCSIDADREVPLAENRSGQQFVRALEGWSELSDNIFVWDYGINFDNYLSPFPNFHVLQENIKRFQANNVTMHFSQIGGAKGCNFAELRAYLVSKLMWNTDADVDALMREFLDGYYGKAGGYLYQYIKLMEGALLASGQRLWIYDSPVTHKNGMLRPALMRRYRQLFDAAEEAVKNDAAFLARVQIARLPIMYSALEIARTDPDANISEVEDELNRFEKRVIKFQIPTLNERNNSPVEYCALYRERYLNQTKNLASGKKVAFPRPPHDRYRSLAQDALTDGLYGGTTFSESWVGWEGQDGSVVLDLEEVKDIHMVSIDCLHQLGAWILLPRKVEFSYSSDGVSYLPWQQIEVAEDKDPAVKFVHIAARSEEHIKARYLKIDITGVNTCPEWHYGVGYTCWFFLDEVVVK